jgi:siroheme synthase
VQTDDPDALTLRDVKRIHAADLVLHDPAVPEAVLEHARRDATIRAVGGLSVSTVPEDGAAQWVVILTMRPAS